jgi:hypothetical protein
METNNNEEPLLTFELTNDVKYKVSAPLLTLELTNDINILNSTQYLTFEVTVV